jgi:hypothetical protein
VVKAGAEAADRAVGHVVGHGIAKSLVAGIPAHFGVGPDGRGHDVAALHALHEGEERFPSWGLSVSRRSQACRVPASQAQGGEQR